MFRLLSLGALLLIMPARQAVGFQPDCSGIEPPQNHVVENFLPEGGQDAAVAVDGCGRYIVVWVAPRAEASHTNRTRILMQRSLPSGPSDPLWESLVIDQTASNETERHSAPTIAMNFLGDTRIAWIGACEDCHPTEPGILLFQDFAYDVPAVTATEVPDGGGPEITDTVDMMPSVGAGDGAAITWVALNFGQGQGPEGVQWGFSPTSPDEVTPCGALCYWPFWQPCMAMRSDGVFVIVWAEAEIPTVQDSPFNIALRLYDANGNELDELIGPNDAEWVNDPSVEHNLSDQLSPAVSFDDAGNIVVVWVGPYLPTCSDVPGNRVFGRRFFWAGGVNDPIVPLSDPFIVDGDSSNYPLDAGNAHPAVALTLDPNHAGRFIVAWNTRIASGGPSDTEIHARYFDENGKPMGPEFLAHAATGETADGLTKRGLARSAAHTIAYGPYGEVYVARTEYGYTLEESQIAVLRLPPSHANELCAVQECLKGDCNTDGLVDGDDIQPFITVLYLGATPPTCGPFDICPYDINRDCYVTEADVPGFVLLLLGAPPPIILLDCNTNGTPDANAIFEHTSLDCNSNFIPDECDAAGATSADVNTNNVPDECEPDCNGNATPDELDITAGTSLDVNTNGVPDECEPDCNTNNTPDSYDVTTAASEDCNSNGVPDECDRDCNSNGTPDYCDVRDLYSNDCNTNLRPDECDDDCNTNGTPDACDLAAQSSPDCNTNRLPDECDLILPFMPSEDANSNGTPDECEEGESAQGGGESGGSGESQGGESEESDASGPAPLTDEQRREALSELLTWIRDNDLRSLPRWQQYPLFDKKARELGLW